MTEIIQKLMTVKKKSEIASEQELAWARRVEVLRPQKVLMEATKDSKELQHHERCELMNNTFGSKINQRRNSHKLEILWELIFANKMPGIWQEM